MVYRRLDLLLLSRRFALSPGNVIALGAAPRDPELSMLVYLTHIGVGKVLDMVAGSCHWWGNRIYDFSRWLIVMVGSIAVSLALRYVIKLAKRKIM